MDLVVDVIAWIAVGFGAGLLTGWVSWCWRQVRLNRREWERTRRRHASTMAELESTQATLHATSERLELTRSELRSSGLEVERLIDLTAGVDQVSQLEAELAVANKRIAALEAARSS